MTHKHTPAPWNIQKPRHFPNSENVHLFIVSGSALVSIMPELQSERTEESEANARLIAAAPELLEALKSIAENGGSTWDYATIGNVARRAVMLAEGDN